MVSATSGMMDEFNEKYNTSDTRLAECTVCHGSSVDSLNPYGQAYQENDLDFAAIESSDSDGDGFSNQDEIGSLTFPGDPEDYPETTSDMPQETEPMTDEAQEQPTDEEPSTETENEQQQSPGFEAILMISILVVLYHLKKK